MAERLGIDRARVCGAWPGLPKMSDTLVEFAQPLLDLLPDEAGLAMTRNVLSLGMLLWNCFVLEASPSLDDRKEAGELRAHVLATASRSGVAPRLRTNLLEELAERKRTLYPDDRRLIAGIDVRPDGDGFHVQAMSILP
jgi:hypothetical protein